VSSHFPPDGAVVTEGHGNIGDRTGLTAARLAKMVKKHYSRLVATSGEIEIKSEEWTKDKSIGGDVEYMKHETRIVLNFEDIQKYMEAEDEEPTIE
jgi:hypothetical protein